MGHVPPSKPDPRLARRSPPAATAPPPWIAGRQWSSLGLRQPGWLLLPLRGFLAVTFCYAGLQKLANPTYLDPHNRASVVGQMQVLQHTSPIGPLLGLSLHAPTLVGLLIAFGELAVGVGVLLGLWTRLAAVGGMLLSLTFFLTVSWTTTPYYYGSDIVFLFAWTVIAGFGAGDVLGVDGWLDARARRLAGLRAAPALISIDAGRLRQLCRRGEACGLQPVGLCTARGDCPTFPTVDRFRRGVRADLDRRRLLLGARAVALVGIAAATTGGLTALVGRLVGGTATRQPLTLRGHRPTPPASPPTPTTSPPASHAKAAPPPGTALAPVSAVPVGQGGRFTDPASGGPAWLVRPKANRFVAFSATCTHAGCTVGFDPASMQFVCPCHGGAFDATTGQVLGGPPPAPLPAIPVHVVNGEIRVD